MERRAEGITLYDKPMVLTCLTVLAAAVLGGAIADGLTVLVVLGTVALVFLGVANGVRSLGDLFAVLRD